jgi:uncharacterized protein
MGTPGRFVWHDLMTTDVERAKSFYAALLGWRYEIADMGGMGEYPMIYVGERGLGGIVALDAAAGVPSHWIAYVTVDDVGAAAARGDAAGGSTCVPPTPIPNVGRFAVITDPGAAVISPFVSASGDQPEEAMPQPAGTVCWNELLTTDAVAALRFYTAVFEWGHGTMDMGPAGTYHLFKRDGKDVAGMMELPAGALPRSLWVPYFVVTDVDADYPRAVTMGVSTHIPPQSVPGVGRFAMLADPTGAVFALFRGEG